MLPLGPCLGDQELLGSAAARTPVEGDTRDLADDRPWFLGDAKFSVSDTFFTADESTAGLRPTWQEDLSLFLSFLLLLPWSYLLPRSSPQP